MYVLSKRRSHMLYNNQGPGNRGGPGPPRIQVLQSKIFQNGQNFIFHISRAPLGKNLSRALTIINYESNTHFLNYFLLLYADKGEVFGWGNSEYNQFSMVTDEQQINLPVKLDLGPIGKVIDIASGGSICMVLNGKFMKNIKKF